MSKHFQRDLDRLHESILSLSAMVEEMIDLAGRALCDLD
jgi:phosphate transport system protein